MNWDNVEKIREYQNEMIKRKNEEVVLNQDKIEKILELETAKRLTIPRLNEFEAMLFKLRTELIDYIVEHGLVDGLIFDGELQPVENSKIVITKEMIERITEKLGYFTEEEVQAFLEEYLPSNFYVSDQNYVHTDNNFEDDEKTKLSEIEDGAEVNKIIDVIFGNVSVLDDGTRIATITKEMVKALYEENENTNAFTDIEKSKLESLDTWSRAAQFEIEKNSEDIETNKEGIELNEERIGELGAEVNSHGGRLTTIERMLQSGVLEETDFENGDICIMDIKSTTGAPNISPLGVTFSFSNFGLESVVDLLGTSISPRVLEGRHVLFKTRSYNNFFVYAARLTISNYANNLSPLEEIGIESNNGVITPYLHGGKQLVKVTNASTRTGWAEFYDNTANYFDKDHIVYTTKFLKFKGE